MDDVLRGWLRTASAGYQRFAVRSTGADPECSTRLTGWSVADLVAHVTWAASMQAEALQTAAGATQAQRASHGVADAVAAFESAVGVELDAQTPVTLPAGTVPVAYAAPLFAFEAALHAADLEHALGIPGTPFNDAEVAACEVVIGPMLDLIAADAPGDGVVIDLIGLGDGIRLSGTDGGWRRSLPEGGPATTTLTGSPQELILFACGRIDATALEVQGVAEHARLFKTYFPGP